MPTALTTEDLAGLVSMLGRLEGGVDDAARVDRIRLLEEVKAACAAAQAREAVAGSRRCVAPGSPLREPAGLELRHRVRQLANQRLRQPGQASAGEVPVEVQLAGPPARGRPDPLRQRPGALRGVQPGQGGSGWRHRPGHLHRDVQTTTPTGHRYSSRAPSMPRAGPRRPTRLQSFFADLLIAS